MDISSISGGSGGIMAMLRPNAPGKGQGPPLAKTSFSDLDTNQDGVISQDELAKALGQVAPADGTTGSSSASDKAAKLFQKIDTDGNGQISSTEWSAFQQKMQAHHHHHHGSGGAGGSQDASQGLKNLVSQLYKSADTNSDGQLSQDEMTTWLQNALGSSSVNQVV